MSCITLVFLCPKFEPKISSTWLHTLFGFWFQQGVCISPVCFPKLCWLSKTTAGQGPNSTIRWSFDFTTFNISSTSAKLVYWKSNFHLHWNNAKNYGFPCCRSTTYIHCCRPTATWHSWVVRSSICRVCFDLDERGIPPGTLFTVNSVSSCLFDILLWLLPWFTPSGSLCFDSSYVAMFKFNLIGRCHVQISHGPSWKSVLTNHDHPYPSLACFNAKPIANQ